MPTALGILISWKWSSILLSEGKLGDAIKGKKLESCLKMLEKPVSTKSSHSYQIWEKQDRRR